MKHGNGTRILIVLAVCFLAGCAGMPEEEAPALLNPVGVWLDTEKVIRDDFFHLSVYDGSVVPYTEGLHFEKDGVFLEMLVMPGDRVKAGDIVAITDEKDIRKQYGDLADEIAFHEAIGVLDREILAIDYEIARMTLGQSYGTDDPANEAYRRAAAEDLELSLRQFDQKLALSIQSMRDRLDGLAEQLGRNTITAPFDGQIVYTAYLRPGWRVTAADPVVYITDNTRLSLQSAYVSVNDLTAANEITARIGDKTYEVIPDAVDMSEFLARTLAGAPNIITYTFKEPPAGLTPGMYAAVMVKTRLKKDVLLIPANAVYSDAGGRYVYLMIDGERVRKPVTTGLTNGSRTIVTEGLAEGDEVYIKE